MSFADIVFYDGDEKFFCYRSGMTVYEERFVNGSLCAAGWNTAGYMLNVLDDYPTRIDPGRVSEPYAFGFEINGFSAFHDWEFVSFGKTRSENENGVELLTGSLVLKNDGLNISVAVKTVLDGTGIIKRELEITNCSLTPSALGNPSVISGALEIIDEWKERVNGDCAEKLYSLGYPDGVTWGHEGFYREHALPAAGYSVCGRYMSDRFRHPMFILKNNVLGTCFTSQLAWSAGYSFDFNLDTSGSDAVLSYKIRLDSEAPFTVLSPGETFVLPSVHIGAVAGGVDEAVNEMHSHMRKSVFVFPEAKGVYGWVEGGMGPERLMDVKASKHFIDTIAAIGGETFIIDAGWYCPPGTECPEWWGRSGDWYPDGERYPLGIEEVRDYAHEKGLLFGLWLDLERIGDKSKAYEEHPSWTLTDEKGNRTTVLDMTNPEVAEWAEAELARVITSYGVELFRLDNNTSCRDLFRRVNRGNGVEPCAARYFEAVYKMYGNLRRRFPDVIFENCAGGGGRTDIGLVSAFSHTWVSDWQIAPGSAVIMNGMTMALPPERVDRLVGGMNSHTKGDIDFMSRVTVFGRPTLNDFNAVGTEMNPVQTGRVRHAMDIYKKYVRPFAADGRIYHHTPELYRRHSSGELVIERSSPDGSVSVIGVFSLGSLPESEYRVYPRGIKPQGRYRVITDNCGAETETDGFSLVNDGIRVRLTSALTSELIILEKI